MEHESEFIEWAIGHIDELEAKFDDIVQQKKTLYEEAKKEYEEALIVSREIDHIRLRLMCYMPNDK